MKKYTGTKTIMATAMLLSEFNLLTGKDHIDPASERDGYLVEYPLVGEDDTPNHPDYAGYISWSPKAAFEAAYTEDRGSDGQAPYGHRRFHA
jgi:hypothetical protein